MKGHKLKIPGFAFLSLFLFAFNALSEPMCGNSCDSPLRFISLDGGGMLGLIPITLLEKIEEESGRPIVDLVDGMMGSSSGGIVAAMLHTPKQQWDLTPKFSVADIHQSYVQNAMKVFNMQAQANAAAFLTGLNLFQDHAGAAAEFDTLLEANVGHVYMSHTLKPLMISSFNVETQRIEFFDSQNARMGADYDLPLKQALRATTALEFIFGMGTVKFNTSEAKAHWIDAGRVGYNDPTGFFCDTLTRRYPGRRIVVYSLGTGFGTSRKTQAYMNGLNPNIEVVRIEPDFEDRKSTYLYWLLKWMGGSDAKAENFDANYLSIMPFPSYISYIEEKAQSTLNHPEFQRMLQDLVGQGI